MMDIAGVIPLAPSMVHCTRVTIRGESPAMVLRNAVCGDLSKQRAFVITDLHPFCMLQTFKLGSEW